MGLVFLDFRMLSLDGLETTRRYDRCHMGPAVFDRGRPLIDLTGT
ncbi:MAG: hypothetical protein P4L84_36220 [Isosphaeraceae bacterium]|nr:hypothetical protein [Isosphaeraceae bacterium]